MSSNPLTIATHPPHGAAIKVLCEAWRTIRTAIDRRAARWDRTLAPRTREMNSKRRKRVVKLRREIISTLGAACECCGETIKHALTIDHRHNDGAAHRRQLPDVRDLYRDILAQGCPRDRFAILCQNCHNSKNERGECAHVAEARAVLGLAA